MSISIWAENYETEFNGVMLLPLVSASDSEVEVLGVYHSSIINMKFSSCQYIFYFTFQFYHAKWGSTCKGIFVLSV